MISELWVEQLYTPCFYRVKQVYDNNLATHALMCLLLRGHVDTCEYVQYELCMVNMRYRGYCNYFGKSVITLISRTS